MHWMGSSTIDPQSASGPGSVIVVGAGIVGTCCALHLQRRGFAVTLIDRAGPGEQCSFGNGGNLGYASSVPLATPGIWRRAPSMLFDPDAPLRIAWTQLPRLAPWLARFVAASAPSRVADIADARASLLRRLYDGYAPLIAGAGAQDLIHRGGLLYVWESENAFRRAEPIIAMRRRGGATMRLLRGDEARELAPALTARVTRAAFAPEVGQVVNPLRLTQTLAAAFARSGGTVLREEVTGFLQHGVSVQGVTTHSGAHRTDRLVIAAGAWSGRLLEKLGWRVPLEAERGYHAMIARPGIDLRVAVVSADRSIGATPMEHGVRIVGITELAGLDRAPDYRQAERITRLAKGLLPGLAIEGAVPWMGHRPSLPDSLPVLGSLPGRRNVLLAFGHDHVGLALAGITGELVTELALGETPCVDLAPFRPDRFARTRRRAATAPLRSAAPATPMTQTP